MPKQGALRATQALVLNNAEVGKWLCGSFAQYNARMSEFHARGFGFDSLCAVGVVIERHGMRNHAYTNDTQINGSCKLDDIAFAASAALIMSILDGIQ